MGYCPRCGENAPYGESAGRPVDERVRCLRIPAGSRIVDLGDAADGSVVSYGGARFRVRRRDAAVFLELAD